MRSFLIFILSCILVLHSAGQTILHSAPETRDFDRFRFHVITRKDGRLVVYKATYFVFIGLSHSLSSDKPETAGLFTIRPNNDSLDYSTVVAGKIYIDDIHILVDNTRNRYILSSFFSQEPMGNIEGLFIQLRDAVAGRPTRTVFTAISDSLRLAVGKHRTLRKVFNNYYVQDMRLLADGGFTLEAQDLVKAPEGYYEDPTE